MDSEPTSTTSTGKDWFTWAKGKKGTPKSPSTEAVDAAKRDSTSQDPTSAVQPTLPAEEMRRLSSVFTLGTGSSKAPKLGADPSASSSDDATSHAQPVQSTNGSAVVIPPVIPEAPSSPRKNLKIDLRETSLSQRQEGLDFREDLLDRRERELERRDRELDRRERELERRDREFDRRQREFEQERAQTRVAGNNVTPPIALGIPQGHAGTPLPGAGFSLPSGQWEKALGVLKVKLEKDLIAERKNAELREVELEARMDKKIEQALEKERQTYYGFMRMSDHEVNEMVQDTVGYLLQKDEDIADRVRFSSLLHLSQEKLATEAGLELQPGSESLAFAWRTALGPSVVTEDRYNKALELLKDRNLDPATTTLLENKQAVEYVSEFTSHLRKEGSEVSDQTFAPGRILRGHYLDSVKRQAKQSAIDYDALVALVDYISPEEKA